MERYLDAFGGAWRLITDDDMKEDYFHCDICYTKGNMAMLRKRLANASDRSKEFTHFEPYLCSDHGRELGVVW